MTCINLSKELIETLKINEISIQDYKPAYSGESVALDLYYPEDEAIYIQPEDSKLIPTGLKISVPPGYVALLRERGSITKTSFFLRAGVIDPGYTGEVFVNLVNYSNNGDWILPQSKLPVQLLVVPCVNQFTIVSDEDFQSITKLSKRAEGKIGSSG